MALGNIQGGPFEDWVTNQIEQRELSLGQGSGKNPKDLLYQQSKTPWLRLASSVNIKATTSYGTLDRLLSIPSINRNEIEGISAARNFILQGGALSIKDDNSINLNSGLNTGTGNLVGITDNLSGAYGWGGTTERGLVPMPGITSASVKYENDGALTKTTINIKCYSRAQFALVDALYMRPGYTLLLEFGWSTYLNTTDGDALLTGDEVKLETTDPFFTPALSLLLNPETKTTKNQYKIIQKIKEERKRTSGNYEAVYGKIVNFKWSIDPDGSYNCVVELRGLGEVIESLKLNINSLTDQMEIDKLSKKAAEDDLDNEDEIERIPLIALAQAGGTLPKILFAIYQNIRTATGVDTDYWISGLGGGSQSESIGKGVGGWVNKQLGVIDPGEDMMKDVTINDFPLIDNSGNFSTSPIVIKNGVMALVQTTTDDENNFTPQVYITFGYLIALIQKSIVPKNKATGCPLFSFDMNFKSLHTDKNYIRRLPGQFSINPLKCLIPYNNHTLNSAEIKYNTKLEYLLDWPTEDSPRSLNAFIKKHNKNWVFNQGLGRLSQIYLNINNIATILQELETVLNDVQKNDQTLISFINTILKDTSINLGSINNVRLHIPNDGELARFIENIPQTYSGASPITYKNKMCTFATFGFNNNVIDSRNVSSVVNARKGSIVRNLGIDASIPSNFSTMISIGAQANGSQLGGTATSFSNYNTGIIDRVIPTKVIEDSSEDTTDPLEDQVVKLSTVINQMQNSTSLGQSWVGRTFNQADGLMGDVYRDREWYGDDLRSFINLGTTYHQLLNGIYTQDPSVGGTGILKAPFFLPFNLSLDIDGIAGIVMMQRFEIDQKILPPSYDKDSVEIIVKGVDHEITPESWVTKLGTQSVPKIKKRKSTETELGTGAGGGPTGKSTSKITPKVKRKVQRNDSDDPLLRMKLITFWSNESVTLGVLNILNTDESTVILSLPTVQTEISPGSTPISQDLLFVDRYLVTNEPNDKYPNALWVIGNSSNDYSFDRIYKRGKGGERSNVLIYGEALPNSIGPNVGVGLGFQMAQGNTQYDRFGYDRSGLGAYISDSKGAKEDGDEAMALIYQILGQESNWYMDVSVYSPPPTAGGQPVLDNHEKRRNYILNAYKANSKGGALPLKQDIYDKFDIDKFLDDQYDSDYTN